MKAKLSAADYFKLFLVFFKIGAFTFGGGYAMLPIIEREVVKNKKWVEPEEFVDVLAICQSAPGAIAVNSAVFIGYKTGGVLGSLAALLGTALPSFLIILIIAMFFLSFNDNPYVQAAFKGIRPAVFSLILAAVIKLGKSAKINLKNIYIPIIVFVLVVVLKFHPISIVVLAATGGILYYKYFEKTLKSKGLRE